MNELKEVYSIVNVEEEKGYSYVVFAVMCSLLVGFADIYRKSAVARMD